MIIKIQITRIETIIRFVNNNENKNKIKIII